MRHFKTAAGLLLLTFLGAFFMQNSNAQNFTIMLIISSFYGTANQRNLETPYYPVKIKDQQKQLTTNAGENVEK